MLDRVSRRGFLGYAAGSALAALGTAACVGAEPGSGMPRPGGAGTGILGGGKTDNLVFQDGVCISGSTGNDALGPYWTPNIRRTIQLAAPDEPGQRMIVAGHVYSRDCSRAIPGATVVAWQADDRGLYDYNHAGLNQGSSQRELAESETRLRGVFTTSVSGTYVFETIFPREYPLNLLDPANSAYRAPHIHFAVFYTDRARRQHQLVTQMYFLPTDLVRARIPRIEELNAQDGGASSAEASRFVEVAGSSRNVWLAQFDIVLDVSPADVVG